MDRYKLKCENQADFVTQVLKHQTAYNAELKELLGQEVPTRVEFHTGHATLLIMGKAHIRWFPPFKPTMPLTFEKPVQFTASIGEVKASGQLVGRVDLHRPQAPKKQAKVHPASKKEFTRGQYNHESNNYPKGRW